MKLRMFRQLSKHPTANGLIFLIVALALSCDWWKRREIQRSVNESRLTGIQPYSGISRLLSAWRLSPRGNAARTYLPACYRFAESRSITVPFVERCCLNRGQCLFLSHHNSTSDSQLSRQNAQRSENVVLFAWK